MYPLNPRNNITKDYLYYILISDDFTKYAISKSDRAGMPKVNREALFAYECYLPPLSEQRTISEYLDTKCAEIDTLIALKQKKIETLKDYKKSIIYEI